MLNLEAGIHDVGADDYHADALRAEPTLSSSIAKIIVQQSPRHAWTASKRLNPDFEPTNSDAFNVGKAVDSYMTGELAQIVAIDPAKYPAKNGNIPVGWGNPAIRAARDAAQAEGKIPLLPDQLTAVVAMAKAARWQIDTSEEAAGMFSPTGWHYQKTLLWREKNGVWCRARPDALKQDHTIIGDFKSSGGNVDDETFGKQIANLGYNLQAAFYIRGHRALFGTEPKFLFVAQETSAPYALKVHGLTPNALFISEAWIERAIEIWGWCLSKDRWPGYSRATTYHALPIWEERKFEARQLEEETNDGRENLLKAALDFQAPHTEAK